MKAHTAAVLAAEVRRGAEAEALLGTTMGQIYEALATVIDDSMEEEVFRSLNRDNTIYQVTCGGKGGKDLVEIFTAVENVKRQAEKKGLSTMKSISLETGFDLKKAQDQKKVLRQLYDEKPYMVVMAFPCTIWSVIQNIMINKRPLDQLRQVERKILNFVRVVCQMQMRAGRHFLLENPKSSSA